MPTSDGEPVRYSGSCHCGRVRFAFRSSPIRSALRCNCSICRRKNALYSEAYFPAGDFHLERGHDRLRVYRFGDRDVNHWFCPTCGIHPFHDTAQEPGCYRVNLRCVDGLDAEALPVREFDGRGLL